MPMTHCAQCDEVIGESGSACPSCDRHNQENGLYAKIEETLVKEDRGLLDRLGNT